MHVGICRSSDTDETAVLEIIKKAKIYLTAKDTHNFHDLFNI